MITHILFKGLNSFNIGSSMFRKILAIIVAVLIFALVFLAVKFTKVEVPNFNRNLIMLAVVDISAFGLVMWKFGCPMEKKREEEENVESIAKEEVVAGEEKETSSNKTKEEGENAGEDVKEENAGDDVIEENAGEESK
jgi:nucleosome binding factor SPN SPT16 subunit